MAKKISFPAADDLFRVSVVPFAAGGSYVVKAKLEQETNDEAPKVLTGYLRGFMR